MKLEVNKILEKVLRESSREDDETLTEDGATPAPPTDTSATNGCLPVTPLGGVVRRKPKKDLDEKEK